MSLLCIDATTEEALQRELHLVCFWLVYAEAFLVQAVPGLLLRCNKLLYTYVSDRMRACREPFLHLPSLPVGPSLADVA